MLIVSGRHCAPVAITFGLPHLLDLGERLPRPYFGGRPNGRLMDKWTGGILNIGYAPAARIGTR